MRLLRFSWGKFATCPLACGVGQVGNLSILRASCKLAPRRSSTGPRFGQVANLPHGGFQLVPVSGKLQTCPTRVIHCSAGFRNGTPISIFIRERSRADENGHNSGAATNPALTGLPSI